MIKFRLEFHEEVVSDYQEAYSWYENEKTGLGERFLKLVRVKLEQIVKNPEAFSQKTKSGYREAAVEIFPTLSFISYIKRERSFLSILLFIKKSILVKGFANNFYKSFFQPHHILQHKQRTAFYRLGVYIA